MATNAELITQWMSRLGQRTSTRVREDLVTEINSAIVGLERKPFIPWFLQSEATLTLSEGAGVVSLPSDFSLEQEETKPYYTLDGKVYYLTKMVRGAVYGYETTNTRPLVYALIGDTMEIRPLADQDYSITLRYYARTDGGIADDSSDISNVWLLNAPDWVCYRALKLTARAHLQNQPLATDFAVLEAQEKAEIYHYHEAREHQNQDYIVGGISDGS